MDIRFYEPYWFSKVWSGLPEITGRTDDSLSFETAYLSFVAEGDFTGWQLYNGFELPEGRIDHVSIYDGGVLRGEISGDFTDAFGLLQDIFTTYGNRASGKAAMSLLYAAATEGDDVILGSDGRDRLLGNDGADLVHGGGGDDRLEGRTGEDTLLGGSGKDQMRGGLGGDLLEGGFGADGLFGGYGDDTLRAGRGNDRLNGEDGDDVLLGGGGDDRLYGNAGDDRLYGGIGDDYLFGGSGSNRLFGDAGDDLLYADEGQVLLDGGAGLDTAYLTIHGTGSLVELGQESWFRAGTDLLVKTVDIEVHQLLFAGERITVLGSAAKDQISLSGYAATVAGGDGDDVIIGQRQGGYTIPGDRINGNDGNDLLAGGGSGDRIGGDAGDDTIFGGRPDDASGISDSGLDYLDGGAGNDVILMNAFFADESHSSIGDVHDYLDSPNLGVEESRANDTMRGGAGDDTLILTSNDDAWGGTGADVFVFGRGIFDVSAYDIEIHDFTRGTDLVDLGNLLDDRTLVTLFEDHFTIEYDMLYNESRRVEQTVWTGIELGQEDFTGIGDLAFV